METDSEVICLGSHVLEVVGKGIDGLGEEVEAGVLGAAPLWGAGMFDGWCSQ